MDILYSTLVVVGKKSYEIKQLCDFQGWILQFCGLTAQMWCTVIGINLLLQMVWYWDDRRCRTLMPWYMLVIYGTGFTTAGAVTFRDLIRPLGSWCWVGGDWPIDRMVFFYAPLWILFTGNVFIVGWIIRAFGKAVGKIPKDWDNRATIVKHYRWVTFHTSMFVAAGMLIWLPGTVNRILETSHETPYWLTFLQILLTPSQGMFNFLLYVTPMWSKSVADSRKQSLLDDELQMAKLNKEKDVKIAKASRRQTEPVPDSKKRDKRVGFVDDDDEIFENMDVEVTRSHSMPRSFRFGEPERPQLITSLRRSVTDHQLQPAVEPRQKITKYRMSFNFHNYTLVEINNKLLPAWEVNDALRRSKADIL